eukprot:2475315-Alexandrium_andersonii.AAC.1
MDAADQSWVVNALDRAQEPIEEDARSDHAPRRDTRLPADPADRDQNGQNPDANPEDHGAAAAEGPVQSKPPPWGHYGPPPPSWAPPRPPTDDE